MPLRLSTIHQQISAALKESGRPPDSARLLAVTKGRTVAEILSLIKAGQGDFGESYLQEALPKIDALAEHALCWHFIGRLQRRKLKKIAMHFSWVHSLCEYSQAEHLSAHRVASGLPPLQVCVQVNISHDQKKAGVIDSKVDALCTQIDALPGLRLRGLMTILSQSLGEAEQDRHYRLLTQLYHRLKQLGFELDTLSMGMSADFPVAIKAGATWVRVGRVLFES